MSGYPYTEACDFIRRFGGTYDADIGCTLPSLSRCDASQIRGAIAKAIGMDDAELAKKIADYARMQDSRAPASEGGRIRCPKRECQFKVARIGELGTICPADRCGMLIVAKESES